MKLTFNNRDPVYLQVVRYFKEEIVTGRLKAGQEIPSRRELAGILNINPNTAQKAYKEMEEQGLIRTEGNSHSRIAAEEDILHTIRGELISEAVGAFISSVKSIEIPVDELLHIVKEAYIEERSKKQED
jgi:GntR family transcriptional regulator